MASLQSLKLPIYPSSPDPASPQARRSPAAAAPPVLRPSAAEPPVRRSFKLSSAPPTTAPYVNGHSSPELQALFLDAAAPPLRVAYQGAPGAYSEFAATTALPGSTPAPYPSNSAAVAALRSGAADRAILPVESTLSGTALRNYDLLLRHDLAVVQEISLFVHYCLLAMPGVQASSLRRVISHPTALAHCARAISSLGLPSHPVDDTAGAVEMLRANHLLDTAAIASPRTAALYGLDVLAHGIQDESWNVTRFLILSNTKQTLNPASKVKTSIVVAHRGGSMMVLLKVLSAFSARNVNLTKLEVNNPEMEGRKGPVMALDVDGDGCLKAFPHVLYVDFEGSTEEERVKEALKEIAGFSVMVRVLGSYAVDTKIYDLY